MVTKTIDEHRVKSEPSVAVVVPLLNEAENLENLHARLATALEPFPTSRILFVDDGSVDESIVIIKRLASQNRNVRFISLTRNFGHQIALKTGLQHCDADVVISMDADLQHLPEAIPDMINAWKNGYLVVNMIRGKEKTSVLKRLTSRVFYKLINAVSDFEIVPGSSDFRLLDRKVVELINALPERCVFLRGVIPWLGFEQCDLTYQLEERQHGERKYNLFKMLQLAATGITSSSTKPLRVAFVIGAVTSSVAVLYAGYAFLVKILFDTAISGWASLLIGMMLLGGVQLLMLGVIGEYVGRVFLEVKSRPHSIIRESDLD